MKSRQFDLHDQAAFAALSGDRNPLHIDAVAARRLLFGAPVVHGIHSALWALDAWMENRPEDMRLRSIQCEFPRPIRMGEEVCLSLKREEQARVRIELLAAGAVATKLEFEWEKSERRDAEVPHAGFPPTIEPRVVSEQEIESRSGAFDLCLDREAAARMFPRVVDRLAPLQIAALLATSRLVGVECPGMHSVYSELSLAAAGGAGATGGAVTTGSRGRLAYRVAKVDRRFGLVWMEVKAAGMAGEIKAYIRPRPQEQGGYADARKLVRPGEFAGQRALVIGGTRGLGEATAKLLAAGGAEVRITYRHGREEAERIVKDIASGGGAAGCFQFDVLSFLTESLTQPDPSPSKKPEARPDASASPNSSAPRGPSPLPDPIAASLGGWRPTHLYYFATPFAFAGTRGVFSVDLFKDYCNYYVDGFLNLVDLFAPLRVRNFFYPSTVAIDELPPNMGEYVAAKSAAESLCAFLEKNRPGLVIHRPRLPRLRTDQTVSILPVHNPEPAPVLLEHLRAFRDRAGAEQA